MNRTKKTPHGTYLKGRHLFKRVSDKLQEYNWFNEFTFSFGLGINRLKLDYSQRDQANDEYLKEQAEYLKTHKGYRMNRAGRFTS